jgi:Secretion system C-terminal sorting domain
MRKILRFAVFALMMVGVAQAQTVCIPNPLYASLGIPGVYPNPLIQASLASGNQGSPYTETFTMVVPADTTIDLSAQIGIPFPPISVSVNYQEVTALNGLPNGLNYVCDQASCQWTGGTNGCIKLSGTPTQGGIFTVGMSTGYNVSVPAQVPVIGGSAITIPIPGLSWTLDITGVGVNDAQENTFWIAHNAPNPFHGSTTIRYHAPKPSAVSFTVTDLAGRRLHAETLRATMGDNQFTFDASNIAPGIYLYQLSNGDNTAIRKMVIE